MRVLPHGARATRMGDCELLLELASHDTTVFLARRTGPRGFSRLVTVRYVGPFLGADAAEGERFLRDAELAATVLHPCLLRIHELGAVGPGRFMVTDYIEGGSLADLMAQRPGGLDAPVVCAIARDVLDGLAAIHDSRRPGGGALSIAHGRLSPRSVIVGIDGRARVADLALARIAATRTATEKARDAEPRRPLSVRYAAPEVLRGQPASASSDVFSAGLVLYEALGGPHPLGVRVETDDSGPREMLAALSGGLPLLSVVAPGVSDSVAQVIARATSVDPALRYRRAEEMRRALERALDPASSRVVGQFVAESLREPLDARRAAVRGWTEAHERALDTDERTTLWTRFRRGNRASGPGSSPGSIAARRRLGPWVLAAAGALAGAVALAAVATPPAPPTPNPSHAGGSPEPSMASASLVQPDSPGKALQQSTTAGTSLPGGESTALPIPSAASAPALSGSAEALASPATSERKPRTAPPKRSTPGAKPSPRRRDELDNPYR